ncbi:MAG TPA: alpha-glucosidase C-terminal domain-containing protein, partial [Pyrinomonadaceae bacterium]
LRHEHAALRSGRLIDLFFDDDAYVFARQIDRETIVIAINRENKAKQVTIPVGSIGLKDGVMLKELIGNVRGRVVNGEAVLTLPAQSAIALGSF